MSEPLLRFEAPPHSYPIPAPFGSNSCAIFLQRFQLEAPKLPSPGLRRAAGAMRCPLQIIGQYIFATPKGGGRSRRQSDVFFLEAASLIETALNEPR